MVGKRKSYRLRVILSLSNINTDFLQLILCMFVSHYLIGNPLYGAALFLFANIWIIYFEGNLRNMSASSTGRSRTNLIMWILLSASIFAGLAIVFFYPIVMRRPEANYVSFFVAMLAARSLLTFKSSGHYNKKKSTHRWFRVLFQLLFLLPCIGYALLLLDGAAVYVTIGGFAVTGFLLSFQSSTLVSFGKYMRNARRNDKMKDIASYSVFSNMNLYSQVAFSLGILMYICYVSFAQTEFVETAYLVMAAWLVVIIFSSEAFTWLVNKNGKWLSLNLFIAGAVLWIVGSVKIYDTDLFGGALWTLLWGFGLACITSVMNRYNNDFKMVARIAGRRVTDRELYFRSLMTQMVAVIMSYCIMLIVLTVWTFVIPNFEKAELPGELRNVMIQLPVLFMVVSIIFALRQPLDKRSREKLENYEKGTSHNAPTKQNLKKTFVEKSRVRFGIKIIAAFVRPFLRLKVSGTENLERGDYPSIFICNHGLFYGPIAAVIYLPTYFRPWVDLKMIDLDLCSKEIYDRELYKATWLPKGFRRWLSRTIARPVTWALNSFNPIPVDKRSPQAAVATFDETVKVLAEGDNVLIFPEKPKKVKKKNKMTVAHERRTVGSLYTGFANIGQLYYEKTGKALSFYPIYASKQGHTFRIGAPVRFDPGNEPREEKQRIADELHEKMLGLRQ